MIRELINIELNDFEKEGLKVHLIKNYEVRTKYNEPFLVQNYSILLIKSGEIKIQVKGLSQELNSRDLLVIPKKTLCTLREIKGKLQLFLLSFTSEFAFQNCLNKELVDSFYFLLGEPLPKIVLEEKDFLLLSLVFKLIYFVKKDTQRNVQDNELQNISFNLFLYELKFIFSRYTMGNSINMSRQESLTIEFLTVLTIHCKKQHNAKFYAGALFVTPGHLNRTVKLITGKTVKCLINQAVINEIKNLLENSKLSIAFIAQDFEFSNLTNFSAFFRKHTSISPSEYRQNTVWRFKNH